MFTNEHFELLAEFDGMQKDNNNPDHTTAYEELWDAYDFTAQWANLVCKMLFKETGGYVRKIRRPTNQANSFKNYTWARIYPNKSSPVQLAYTVGITTISPGIINGHGFVVKIDTVGVRENNPLRVQYNHLRADNNIVATLSRNDVFNDVLPEGLVERSINGLAEWACAAIMGFKLTYDAVAEKLGLHSLTDEQILNHFCTKEGFRAFFDEWDEEQKKHFYSLARTVHSHGLDWWHVDIGYQVRFGRKNKKGENGEDNVRAKLVLGAMQDLNPRRMRLNHNIHLLNSFDYQDVSKELLESIEENFENGISSFLEDKKLENQRDGYWPDELEIVSKGNDSDEENNDLIVMGSPLNQILYGPPGTGKTYSTIQEALRILDNKFLESNKDDRAALKHKFDEWVKYGKIRFTTFHQSFGYEDFVEGLRAKNDDTKPSGVHYFIEQGIFRSICEAASKEKSPYVLIIDEINRGNISKIFGELITLIEPSKRSGAKEAIEVILPYSKEKFSIPSNVHIIGTMNTADRSLALLDTALRRRFDFIPLYPDTRDETDAPLAGLTVSKAGEQVQIDVRLMLETINKRIEVLYDKDHCIGHAYFTSLKEIQNEHERFVAFVSIFKNKIIPLLEEYFFEDWNKIRLVLGDNQKAGNVPKFIIENKEIPNDLAKLFGSGHGLDELSDKTFYKVNDEAFNNIEAYTGIYSSVKNA